MNKIKNFFFNKIETGKTTNFSDLVNSFIFGGLKIFIFFMINGIVSSLLFTNNSESEFRFIFATISSLISLLILIYILANRIPNQFRIFKNYLNTNNLIKKNTKPIIINTVNYKQMNFLDFLKYKRNLIIKFLIINVIALFVNVFHIEGVFHTEGCDSTSQTKHALFTKKTVTIYDDPYNEETSSSSNGKMENFSKSNFYPFVPFLKHSLFNGKSYCSNSFYGIFAFYDYSEFIAYSFLLFIILYFYWDKKVRLLF